MFRNFYNMFSYISITGVDLDAQPKLEDPVLSAKYKLKDGSETSFGMAWSGLNPYGGNNAYNNDYHEQYPVTIIINNKNNPLVAGYGVGIRSKLLGYFVRADWAWGINNGEIQKMMFYLSLSLDF